MKDLAREIDEIKIEFNGENFWQDPKKAGEISSSLGEKEKELSFWQELGISINNLKEEKEFLENLAEKDIDPQEKEKSLRNLELAREEIYQKLKARGDLLLFSGSYDKMGAIMTVKSGAGGKDAQDWAEMLFNMYLKYFEKKGFRSQILYHSPGKEVGLKSAEIEISAPFAYGYLKGEHGIHRLVRLSPFNMAGSRETSFASIEICPIFKNSSEKLAEKDLKIETFRAGGAGGQHVNTTSSAVRITHLPTKLTAVCQNERSQNQNKELALRILQSKLALLKDSEKINQERTVKGEFKEASFGNQIRSYVLQPYTLVKDHRTGFSVSNPEDVLNGNLEPFINNYLKFLNLKS